MSFPVDGVAVPAAPAPDPPLGTFNVWPGVIK